jgi:hypothetical protein
MSSDASFLPFTVKIAQDINTITLQNLASIGPQSHSGQKSVTFVKCWEIIADNLSKADGVGAASQRLIPAGEQSGLLMRIAITERGLSFAPTKS